jgi:DNA gyrase subunit B
MARGKSYTEADIQVLGAIAGIRKRPTMYIGSLDSLGVFHIFSEPADNAVDEFLAKRNTAIYVQIGLDGTVTIGDDGQGIPTGIHKQTKRPTIETVFTENHAGGKFGQGAYKESIGTHGVGVTATNACSETLEVWSQYTGSWQHIGFKQGKVVSQLSKAKPPKLDGGMKPSGTIVRYKPDPTIFDKGAKLSTPHVLGWADMAAYMNAGLKITVFDEKTEELHVYHHKRGLDDYIDNRLAKRKVLGRTFLQHPLFDVALAIADTSKSNSHFTIQHFYANTRETSQGGRCRLLPWRRLS